MAKFFVGWWLAANSVAYGYSSQLELSHGIQQKTKEKRTKKQTDKYKNKRNKICITSLNKLSSICSTAKRLILNHNV